MAKLYFYYSTMNAGKSTTLLQSSYNYRERNMNTMVYTAAIDDRFGVFVGVRVPVRMRMWNAQRVHGFVIHFMRVFHIVNMLVAHLRFTSDCLNSIVNA